MIDPAAWWPNKILILLLALLVAGCGQDGPAGHETADIDYRQEMRDLVMAVSAAGRAVDADFLVIPQNGQELLTDSGAADGEVQADYRAAIDGTGREDLFYGYRRDDEATPAGERDYLLALCRLYRDQGLAVLVTDYVSTPEKVDQAYPLNAAEGFIPFAAPDRELRLIPDYPQPIFQENAADIQRLDQAQNFLYLINGGHYAGRPEFVDAVAATNYDLVIMDAFHDGTAFSAAEIARLKTKQNGGARLVIAYLSVGEAEDYRYYWRAEWDGDRPGWLAAENPEWVGNYQVRYWDPAWQEILYAGAEAYLSRILAAGFDGVYLDIIDAFEYFEDQ